MAQTGYTPISIYYSATATNTPTAGNLVAGELAINTADGKLFYKDSSGVVQVLGTKGGVGSSTTTQVLYNSSGLVVGSANMTFDGTTLTANALKSATLGSPSATALTLQSAGTTAVIIDTAQNVGIGNTTRSGYGSNTSKIYQKATGINSAQIISQSSINDSACTIGHNGTVGIVSSTYGATGSYTPLAFYTSDAERMRIDSSGNLLIGTTAAPNGTSVYGSAFIIASSDRATLQMGQSTTNVSALLYFYNPNGQVGTITTSGSATAYNTSSDYRLKEDVLPMTGALNKVAQLNPVTYKWKADGAAGQGFIAHELAKVVPECVSGEKDAVDENGKPEYQGVDVSFLVATLTAAIQELNAKVDAQAAEIATLKAK